MELPVLRFPQLWQFRHNVLSENHVQWLQTPDCHIYSAHLSGVKKEEIRVEVEDSRYLIIRTETNNSTKPGRRSFMKKIRLPSMVNIEATLAVYKEGQLTVKVPRLTTRTRFFIHPSDLPQHLDVLVARAA